MRIGESLRSEILDVVEGLFRAPSLPVTAVQEEVEALVDNALSASGVVDIEIESFGEWLEFLWVYPAAEKRFAPWMPIDFPKEVFSLRRPE